MAQIVNYSLVVSVNAIPVPAVVVPFDVLLRDFIAKSPYHSTLTGGVISGVLTSESCCISWTATPVLSTETALPTPVDPCDI